MSLDEKTTFGATIITPPNDLSTTAAQANDTTSLPDANNPFSAFYSHPPARRSLQEDRPPTSSSAKGHLTPQVFIHDIESQSQFSRQASATPKVSVDGRPTGGAHKECTAWPSKATLLEKQRAATRQKGAWGRMRCRWAEIPARKRLCIQILLALFVIAAAVGLGVGISRTVGGRVWVAEGKSATIPHDS